MQTALLVSIMAMICIAVLSYLIRQSIRIKKMELRLRKLYGSQMFLDMKPLLITARRCNLDDLTIDKTGVTWRYFQLPGSETGFLMNPNGYEYLTPEQQEAMRAMMEDKYPKLKDPKLYHYERKPKRLLNGTWEYSYRYTMTSAYKASLSRYAYYDGTLQPRSW